MRTCIHLARLFLGKPDDTVRRKLVSLKYWILNLMPLMVYPKVLFPPNFVIKEASRARGPHQ